MRGVRGPEWYIVNVATGSQLKYSISGPLADHNPFNVAVDESTIRWVSRDTIEYEARACEVIQNCWHFINNKEGLSTNKLIVAQMSPVQERIYSFDLSGIKLGMDAQTAVNKFVQVIEAKIPGTTDWIDTARQCSPAAVRAMSTDGVQRSSNLQRFCFGTVYVGTRGSWSTAFGALSFVEDPLTNKSVVALVYSVVVVPQGTALDSDAFLGQLTRKYGGYDYSEAHVDTSGGNAFIKDHKFGRYVWGQVDDAFLAFQLGIFGNRGPAGQPVLPGFESGEMPTMVGFSDAYLPPGSYLFMADYSLMRSAAADYTKKTTQYVTPSLQ